MKRISAFFKLDERNTTFKAEIIAGVTTFMAMAYVLMVNPGMFADLGDVSYGAVYIATAISATVGTILIGLLANLPLAQASGIGLSAFFVYTVCLDFGFTYANALLFVLLDGIIFILLTVTGLRRLIFESIPHSVKIAIPAGIGLFIAFLGMKNAGLIVPDPDNAVSLVSFNILAGATWGDIMPLLILLITIFAIAALSQLGVKGAILWSMLGASVIYYLLGFTVPGFYDSFLENLSLNPFAAFAEFGTQAFGKVFTEGFDFSHYLSQEGNNIGGLILSLLTTALAFCMVDMFDTMGTLYSACRASGLLERDDKGNEILPNNNRAMLADAIATCIGSVSGTSTVTSYIESSAGVSVGGRTGLSSMVTGALFAVSIFLTPIAQLIPACAYSAALVYVGVLMIGSVLDIDWKSPEIAVPAFITVVMMPFTFNLSTGIGFGVISYVMIKLFMGKIKEIKLGSWIIMALFAAMFLLTH